MYFPCINIIQYTGCGKYYVIIANSPSIMGGSSVHHWVLYPHAVLFNIVKIDCAEVRLRGA